LKTFYHKDRTTLVIENFLKKMSKNAPPGTISKGKRVSKKKKKRSNGGEKNELHTNGKTART